MSVEFWRLFFSALPELLPRWVASWIVTFAILVALFRWVKRHLRPHVLRVDDQIRTWARGLRFREIAPDQFVEKVPLTWFMRFWTNFASAPSLSLISLAMPAFIFQYHLSQMGKIVTVPSEHWAWNQAQLWLLPGLCYAGSMSLSYTLKRVFKRLRPPREIGAFGYKMKDGSFPSGHSLTSFCFWVMMTLTLAFSGAAWPLIVGFGVLALTIIGLTGLSRIYLGVHFPSDVAGGFTIGAVWCVLCGLALFPLVQR